MRTRTNRILGAIATLLVASIFVACSGGGSGDNGGGGTKFPRSPETIKQGDPYPILANTELVVGANRIAVGVIGPDSRPLVDAKVHFAFYNLNGGKETKTQEMDAVSRVPGRDAQLPAQETIRLPDGTTRQIFNAGEEVGIYTANVNFADAGDWGVEIVVKSDNPTVDKTFRPRFNVIQIGRASCRERV